MTAHRRDRMGWTEGRQFSSCGPTVAATPQTPIVITGATGFVGRAVVQRFLASGVDARELRCLVRSDTAAARAGLTGVQNVVGTLEDSDALARACDGAAAVVHLAGATRALRRHEFRCTNAEGTARLIGVLRRSAPAARFVHVSSLAAAGPSVDGATSARPAHRCVPRSHYGASKRDGELAVAALEDRQPWIVLRPPIVYGPEDAATRLLVSQACAPLTFVPWRVRPLSLIHVDDLAAAIELAVVSSLTRHTIPLDGPNRLDTDRIMTEFARACGRSARLVRVPVVVARAAALAADVVARLRGRPSYFSLDKVRDVAAPGWVADPIPAREHLGFVATRGTSEGFRSTVDSIRATDP